MSDLISREALKKAINEYAEKREDVLLWENDVIDIIDNAPTVDTYTEDDMSGAYNEGYSCGSREARTACERPQGEWIPISDRLPDNTGRYLVYTKYDEVMTDYFEGTSFLQGEDIIAWQPLPEPYRADMRGEEE